MRHCGYYSLYNLGCGFVYHIFDFQHKHKPLGKGGVYDTHPELKADTDEMLQKEAKDYWNNYGKLFRREQIEKFAKEVKKGRVVELRNTDHSFFKDPKLQDEVAQMIRDFLLEEDRG